MTVMAMLCLGSSAFKRLDDRRVNGETPSAESMCLARRLEKLALGPPPNFFEIVGYKRDTSHRRTGSSFGTIPSICGVVM
jgi:hypothetical protein